MNEEGFVAVFAQDVIEELVAGRLFLAEHLRLAGAGIDEQAERERREAERRAEQERRAAEKRKAEEKAAAERAAAERRAAELASRCTYSQLNIDSVRDALPEGARRALTPKQLETLEGLLRAERAHLTHQAEEMQAEADALMLERELGDTQFDEESGEGDTIAIERERDLLISSQARETVDEIDRALARIDAGTYGLCVPGGVRIPFERLEAIPWAEHCVMCRNRVERHR